MARVTIRVEVRAKMLKTRRKERKSEKTAGGKSIFVQMGNTNYLCSDGLRKFFLQRKQKTNLSSLFQNKATFRNNSFMGAITK